MEVPVGDEGDLRERLAGALAACCDGELTPEQIAAADCSFTALGVDSLALVRFVDALEADFGVRVDTGAGSWFLTDLDTVARHVAEQRCDTGR
ncbi:acyl carrier protein [Dactylosporangium salmoneum]|uniref:Carrier domain-containing protein n=1 Tax=Dactylosporangium salmoneum TaxID=53361 RepID=A0ABN3H8S1_9ACTN